MDNSNPSNDDFDDNNDEDQIRSRKNDDSEKTIEKKSRKFAWFGKKPKSSSGWHWNLMKTSKEIKIDSK